MQIRVSEGADADLEAIYRYSWETWGSAQANQYVGEIIAAIDAARVEHWRITQFPGLPGTSRIRSGSHNIFLRKHEEGWLVVRILHERRDARQLLDD